MSEQERTPAQEVPPERNGPPVRGPESPADEQEQSAWDAYWERFRRQQVDDPVDENREGVWERFRRQQVDDPVTKRRSK